VVKRESVDQEAVPLMMRSALKYVLGVDPDPGVFAGIERMLQGVAVVRVCESFESARRELLSNPPDLLITNLRLEAYNGLHLVYLAAGTCPSRCIVYIDHPDPAVAKQVHEANAFCVLRPFLDMAVPAYVTGSLPERDRRDPDLIGRVLPEGGRRSTDGGRTAARVDEDHA
jgi:DNA-binding NtrC family response regulator